MIVRFEILPWLYGREKFPGLSINGPLVLKCVIPDICVVKKNHGLMLCSF